MSSFAAINPTPRERNDIMQRITDQAASVRQTFESHSSNKRHIVSSTTVAAAQHMASLNRKHKFDQLLAMRATSSMRPFTIPSAGEQQQQQILTSTIDEWNKSMVCQECVIPHTANFPPPGTTSYNPTVQLQDQECTQTAPFAPRVSDGIALTAFPHDIILNYNDVVCGSGKTTSSLVGNQRFNVWVNLHKSSFAKAVFDDNHELQFQIAHSLVDAVTSSVPTGRFISVERNTRLWYAVGYEQAVRIALESLSMAIKQNEDNASTQIYGGKMHQSQHEPLVANLANNPRVLIPKAA